VPWCSPIRRLPGRLLLRHADLSIPFEHSGIDIIKHFNTTIPCRGHHIVILDSHPAERAGTPLVSLKQNQWSAIEETSDSRRISPKLRHQVVSHGDGNDLADGICKGCIVADYRRQGKATNEEDQDKFEGVNCFPGRLPTTRTMRTRKK
jgi:hypothetical protein